MSENAVSAEKPKGVVYIDGVNLHKGAKSIGLELDYQRLYTWLGFKYGIEVSK